MSSFASGMHSESRSRESTSPLIVKEILLYADERLKGSAPAADIAALSDRSASVSLEA